MALNFKEKKTSLRFNGRKMSKTGLTATVMSGIGWIIFIALTVYSAGRDGNAAQFIGIIGLLDAIMSLVGMLMAYKGLHERDVQLALPVVGMTLNGVLFIVYFSMYIMGAVI